MRLHHTKTKGDLGVLYVQLDLVKMGFLILTPHTEHETFDLVAYRDGMFLRVQVKYRAAVNGKIVVPFQTCWADRHGVHMRNVDRTTIDVFAVYCPDTDLCYYLDPLEVPSLTVSLRIAPTRNRQAKGILLASNFREIPPSVLARRAC